MNTQEQAIVDFLRQTPELAWSRRELARKAVHRTEYEENRNWVDQPLAALVARGDVVASESSLYQLKGYAKPS